MFQKKRAEKRVRMGMTFGGFDLCHQGHVNLLRQAKERCESLVVCVSTNAYLKMTKGVEPLLTLEDRIYLVRLTGYADRIDKQDMRGKKRLIEKYNPDVLFVGDDWTEMNYSGEGLCRVIYLPRTLGINTTWYRDKIRRSSHE